VQIDQNLTCCTFTMSYLNRISTVIFYCKHGGTLKDIANFMTLLYDPKPVILRIFVLSQIFNGQFFITHATAYNARFPYTAIK